MSGGNEIKVWDPAVRTFHWSLVFFYFLTYASGEGSETLHAYAGYIVIGLILFRIVWGFIGTRHARFSDFLYGPKATLLYIRGFIAGRPKHYLGHNPLGGWMAVILMLSVLGASWSGLELYAADGHGPLASNVTGNVVHTSGLLIRDARADDDEKERDRRKSKGRDKKAKDFWEDIHEALANFSMFLVFLHIFGVLLASKVHDEKLVKAMITGYKNRKET